MLACSALAIGAVPAGAATALTASSAAGTASGTVPVIVILKRQLTGATGGRVRSGARSALIQAAQAPYLDRLQQLDATDVHRYRLVDAIAARVPAIAVGQLSASAGVAAVIPDSPITGPSPDAAGAGLAGSAAKPARKTKKTAVAPSSGACSSTPQLEPQGLTLTHTDSAVSQPGAAAQKTARSLGYNGAGVKVAFLADGIDRSNVNLIRNGKSVITDYRDFSGDGTSAATEGGESFLDASAIGGQGKHVYNVAGFGAQVPASVKCELRIEGVAPGASLVALKVFSKNNVSTTSGFLQAIDYAVATEHVSVLNESFGANPFPDVTSLDAVEEFNDMAVAAGVTVVVAAGDAGPFNTIGSPASDPHVISVGASTDFRFYAQTDYAGADQFATKGWENNNISSLSSGGFTEKGRTLSLVAPGDLSFSSCTANVAQYADCVNFNGKASPVEESGGTSESAPEAAGAAALVIQAYRKANGGNTPTPAMVKQILLSTATDLKAPATEQGAGLLNSLKAVELAASTAGHPVGDTLRLSSNQLNYVGKPGATASWAVQVTNAGAKAQAVAVGGRGFTANSVIKKASVTLSDAKSAHFGNWTGVNSNDATVKFTVAKGQALLNTSIAWPAKASSSGNLNKRVRLILVDPSGKLAAHSLPQGVSGYGSAQVLHPAAGTWTAVIFSNGSKSGGTVGKVRFGASVARSKPFGKVSPSTLTLAPGATGTVHISAVVPSGAGDSSGALVLNGGAAAGGAVTVPVTLRGTVAAGLGGGGTFSGVLTGGNGRSPGEGQVASYEFRVPDNLPVLLRNIDADVSLANDPANQVSGYLVAPDGQTMGYGSSYLTTGFNSKGVPVETTGRKLSVYTSNPIPGVWTLVIDFTSPVPGNELSDPFSGRIRFNSVRFDRGKLPDSSAVKVGRGKSVTYSVLVKNTGVAPEDVFLDPRLTTLHTYPLQPQDQVSGLKLPLAATASPPEWIVPTMTHSVSVTATGSKPVMFDFGPFPGDPDVASKAALKSTANYPVGALTTPVTQGLWFAVPSEVGPYGAGGAGPVTAGLKATATTQEFDPAMSSPEGDFWKFGVASLAGKAKYNLYVVQPGKSRTIRATVHPTGKAGTVVSGELYIDDFVDSLQFLSGSQLAMLPYKYKIG